MGRALLWQSVIAVLIALIAAWIGGTSAGIAAILAGLCCVIPNIIFFAGMVAAEKIFANLRPATFFVMEFVKVAISMVLVIVTFWFYRDIHWIAYIISYILILKIYIVLLLKARG
ncbi:MAG: ATP synthase subunit I [Oxalobacter sp.]|nr:ATP synthase subunit I [Oxalobacter sp.]